MLCVIIILAALSCGCARNKHIVVTSLWTDDFCYSIYEDGTAEITAYRGQEEYLKLPNMVGENTVIGFGPKAFDGTAGLKQVLIPPTVTSLPAKLFNACPDLESVYIPSSVKTIGKNVIFECPAFKKVMFSGTEEEWKKIDLGSVPWTDNYILINSEIVYEYSLEQ